MTKFTSEQKMNAVIRYQSGNESIQDVAKAFGANYEVVRMWIKQAEYHGIHAFRKLYTSYSMQYKLDVLNYMNENGLSYNGNWYYFLDVMTTGWIEVKGVWYYMNADGAMQTD